MIFCVEDDNSIYITIRRTEKLWNSGTSYIIESNHYSWMGFNPNDYSEVNDSILI